jgi:hypothetical protein
MFIREKYKRYPGKHLHLVRICKYVNSFFEEATYYILTKMEADMSDQYLRKGLFSANVIFRGVQMGNLEISGFKEDFQLVSKEDEKFYLEKTLPLGKSWRDPTVVDKFIEMPPLLKLILLDQAKERKLNIKEEDIKLPLVVRDSLTSNVQVRKQN